MDRGDPTFYINRLLEETENEVLGGDPSDEELDNVEEDFHNSDTEQSDVEAVSLHENVSANIEPSKDSSSDDFTDISDQNNDIEQHIADQNYVDQCRNELNLDPYSSDEDELPYSQRVCFFLGKPKKDRKGRVIEPGKKWFLKPPPQNVRTPRRNIFIHLPGVKGNAKNATTPIEAWNLLFDNDMIHHVVLCTNRRRETIIQENEILLRLPMTR